MLKAKALTNEKFHCYNTVIRFQMLNSQYNIEMYGSFLCLCQNYCQGHQNNKICPKLVLHVEVYHSLLNAPIPVLHIVNYRADDLTLIKLNTDVSHFNHQSLL